MDCAGERVCGNAGEFFVDFADFLNRRRKWKQASIVVEWSNSSRLHTSQRCGEKASTLAT